jgi:hypothetical protein
MKKGSALIMVVFVIAVFAVLGALFAKIVYNNYAGANAARARAQAFCLAEAGIEKGKMELAHNPAWYTDLPYYLADNAQWLTSYAVGEVSRLGDGSFKIVREKGKDRLYAVGSMGKGRVILKITFSDPPFRTIAWEEL